MFLSFLHRSKKVLLILILSSTCLLTSCIQDNEFNLFDEITYLIQEYKEAQFNSLSEEQQIEKIVATVNKALANHNDPKLLIDSTLVLTTQEEVNLKQLCLDYLAQGKYTALNQQLSKLYEEQKISSTGDFIYRDILDNLAKKQDLAEVWHKKSSNIHTTVTMCIIETNRAWEKRGGGFANTVSNNGWKGFREHLNQAHIYQQQALKLDPTHSVNLSQELLIGLGLGLERNRLQKIVNTVYENNPVDSSVLVYAAYYLTPRWRGSNLEQFNFIKKELPKWTNSNGKFHTISRLLDYKLKNLSSDTSNYKAMLNKLKEVHLISAQYIEPSQATYDTIFKLPADEALKLANEMLKKQPDSYFLIAAKAYALYRLENYKESAKFFEKKNAVKATVFSKSNLAYCYSYLREYKKAITVYESIPFEDLSEYHKFNLIYCYNSNKDYKKATSACMDLIKNSIDIYKANYYLGYAYYSMQQYDKAKPYFLTAVENLSKKNEYELKWGWSNLAYISYHQKDYKEAFYQANKSIQIDNNHATGYCMRGAANYQLGLYDKARLDLNQYIKLAPGGKKWVSKNCPKWRTMGKDSTKQPAA